MNVLAWQRIETPQEGAAVCFDYRCCTEHGPTTWTDQGFAIRHAGAIHVYRNRCPHAGSPLDWEPGRFFDDEGRTLLCHTHGARFDPSTGACLAGPCSEGLTPLPFMLREHGLDVPALVRE